MRKWNNMTLKFDAISKTFKKSYGFDKNWPYNCNISVKLKEKCKNLAKY